MSKWDPLNSKCYSITGFYYQNIIIVLILPLIKVLSKYWLFEKESCINQFNETIERRDIFT